MNRAPSWINVLLLIAGNAIPIVGVVFWDWSGFVVLFLYWLESGIVGVFTILKIVLALPRYEPVPGRQVNYKQDAGTSSRSFSTAEMGRFWVIPSFVLGYGAAMVLFALAVGWLFYPRDFNGGIGDVIARMQAELVPHQRELIAALVLMLFDHAAQSYRDFFGGPEWARADPVFQMWRPFGFLVMLYFLWLVGGFLMATFKTPGGVLVLFVVLKTLGELFTMPFTPQKHWRRIPLT